MLPDMDEVPIRRVASRVAYSNPWLTLREDDVSYADGTVTIFGVVEKPDFARENQRGDGGFWLVSQYRYPVGRRTWEMPQGSWGHDASGTAEELARSELREETGLTASSMHHLGRLAHAPGISPTQFDVYLAEGLAQGKPRPEWSEVDMHHRFVTDDELRGMIASREVYDAPSLAGLALFWMRYNH